MRGARTSYYGTSYDRGGEGAKEQRFEWERKKNHIRLVRGYRKKLPKSLQGCNLITGGDAMGI